MPADLSITFVNLSSTDFQRNLYEKWESAIDVESTLPAEILKSSDTQLMAINNDSLVGEGATTFWCCWYDSTKGVRFGVKIIESGQPFGMGYAPWWQVMSDHASDGDAGWDTVDPASPYEWDQSIGFKILAVPECTHETLHVTVTIENLVS